MNPEPTIDTCYILGKPFRYRVYSNADRGVIEQVWERGDYDLTGIRQADALAAWRNRQTLRPLIIDAGANIGASVVWWAHAHPGAQVIAIEPEVNNFKLLRDNTMYLKDRVNCVLGAVGSAEGFGTLVDPGRGEWGYQVDSSSVIPGAGVAVNTINWAMNVDGAVPYICKIDIEGGEDDLFGNNCEWVKHFPLVIVETHDWMLPGCAVSRNFWWQVSKHRFDVVMRGENFFCFNCDLLYPTEEAT